MSSLNGHNDEDDSIQELSMDPEEYERFQRDPHSYLGIDDADVELSIVVVVGDTPPTNGTKEARDVLSMVVTPPTANENPPLAAVLETTSTTAARSDADSGGASIENDAATSPDPDPTAASKPSARTASSTDIDDVSTLSNAHSVNSSSSSTCDSDDTTSIKDNLICLSRNGRQWTWQSRQTLCRAILDRCATSTGMLERNSPRQIANQLQIDIRSVYNMWSFICESIRKKGDNGNGDSRPNDTTLVLNIKKAGRPSGSSGEQPIDNPSHELCIVHAAIPAIRRRLCAKETALSTPLSLSSSSSPTTPILPSSRLLGDNVDTGVEQTMSPCKDSDKMDTDGGTVGSSSRDGSTVADSSSGDTDIVQSTATLRHEHPEPNLAALSTSSAVLCLETRQALRQALLDRCLPTGRLKRNSLQLLANQFQVDVKTVESTLKQMRKFKTDSDIGTGIRSDNNGTLAVAQAAVPIVRAQPTMDALVTLAPQQVSRSMVSPDQGLTLCEANAPLAGERSCDLNKGALENQHATLARAPYGKRLTMESNEVLCQAILDRCSPNGMLRHSAHKEIATELQVNHMTVYFMWKRMLASVVETGMVDPHFTKAGSKRWFPEVNHDKASVALQKFLAERNKSAPSKPASPMDNHTHAEIQNVSCPMPSLEDAVEFLSRKYREEHQCNKVSFRADGHVRMMLNHVYCLLGPGGTFPLDLESCGDDRDEAGLVLASLYLCHNFNVHDEQCDLFSVHTADSALTNSNSAQPSQCGLCLKCNKRRADEHVIMGRKDAGTDGIQAGDNRNAELEPESIQSEQYSVQKRQKTQ